ncbi:unnamed protein product [Lymnaea stagnalis]|uniref:Uncharacterized protein n=1 Tax=Lymnaea stagnalis TaxID=6523 RepID=A0AAV2IBF3_LYMST
MDNIYNSTGYHQKEAFPTKEEIRECNAALNRPPYPNFDWWYQDPTLRRQKRPKVIRRDELPIPVLPNRYPYRYTSAQPCTVGRTAKELDIYRTTFTLTPKINCSDKLDLRMVNEVRGYETASMSASLQPFRKGPEQSTSGPTMIPFGLSEPLLVPYKSHSKFDEYVVETLHPGWRKDPLYRRCVKFSFQESLDEPEPTNVSTR